MRLSIHQLGTGPVAPLLLGQELCLLALPHGLHRERALRPERRQQQRGDQQQQQRPTPRGRQRRRRRPHPDDVIIVLIVEEGRAEAAAVSGLDAALGFEAAEVAGPAVANCFSVRGRPLAMMLRIILFLLLLFWI